MENILVNIILYRFGCLKACTDVPETRGLRMIVSIHSYL